MAEQLDTDLTGQLSADLIKQNIIRVREDIARYADLSHRDISEITLIGVSKFFPVQAAEEAVNAGLGDLGENRVGDLIEKQDILASHSLFPEWHLIGSLQRKKVRQIVGRTRLIHSVDSIELLEEISKRSLDSGIKSPVLLQINVSHEETKHGFDSSEMTGIIEKLPGYSGVDLQGLMTMAPLTHDENILHQVFSQAQELFLKIKPMISDPSFRILSMGMSNDYHIAIQHGATHLRIGTAIFGHRIY